MDDAAKLKQIAITTGAWTAIVLSVYSVFVILNTWFLVPNDPSKTPSQNLTVKLEIIVAFAATLIVLLVFARWAFAKRRQHGNSK
jgi:hypothetical protein